MNAKQRAQAKTQKDLIEAGRRLREVEQASKEREGELLRELAQARGIAVKRETDLRTLQSQLDGE